MSDSNSTYFIPDPSRWPLVGSIALFLAFVGGSTMLNGSGFGTFILGIGVAAIVYMFAGWFAEVIGESLQNKYNKQVDVSFRWGMAWFIFSEVMFFAAFFGALFYIRFYVVDWIGGVGDRGPSGMLWPEYTPEWPMLNTPDPSRFPGAKEVMSPWGLPLINTILLVTSSFTVTFAHHGIKEGNRKKLTNWLGLTVVLGIAFLFVQAYEYYHAYHELGLTLNAGIYGTTFFMLTGFHGAHVTLGTFMLLVMYGRALKGHFTSDDCFGFEAASWYWHFVDVVWLGLFVFVYVLGS